MSNSGNSSKVPQILVTAVRANYPKIDVMLRVVDACQDAGVSLPEEVVDYFGPSLHANGRDVDRLRERFQNVPLNISEELQNGDEIVISINELPEHTTGISIRLVDGERLVTPPRLRMRTNRKNRESLSSAHTVAAPHPTPGRSIDFGELDLPEQPEQAPTIEEDFEDDDDEIEPAGRQMFCPACCRHDWHLPLRMNWFGKVTFICFSFGLALLLWPYYCCCCGRLRMLQWFSRA